MQICNDRSEDRTGDGKFHASSGGLHGTGASPLHAIDVTLGVEKVAMIRNGRNL